MEPLPLPPEDATKLPLVTPAASSLSQTCSLAVQPASPIPALVQGPLLLCPWALFLGHRLHCTPLGTVLMCKDTCPTSSPPQPPLSALPGTSKRLVLCSSYRPHHICCHHVPRTAVSSHQLARRSSHGAPGCTGLDVGVPAQSPLGASHGWSSEPHTAQPLFRLHTG